MKSKLHELRSMHPSELKTLMACGEPMDAGSMDNHIYLGVSLGLPQWIEALSWTTFLKAFCRDTDTGQLRGWNIRLEQEGLEGPVVAREKGGKPIVFGHFLVEENSKHGPGFLLDYGRGANHSLNPISRLRDPLVTLPDSDGTLILGCSFLDVGFWLPTPSYFVLKRHCSLLEPIPMSPGEKHRED